MSAGWVHPIGRLLEDNRIQVEKCNAIVKAVSTSFMSMCLPGAVNSFYNPFGELYNFFFNSDADPMLLFMFDDKKSSISTLG